MSAIEFTDHTTEGSGRLAGRSLRVLLASDWFLPRLGGIELQVADLASTLVAAGHQARVLTTTPDPNDRIDPKVRRLRGPLGSGLLAAVSPKLLTELRGELLRGYDVLHAHASVVSPLALGSILAARTLQIPTVVTFHSVLLASAAMLRAADLAFGWSRWPIVMTAVSKVVASQLRNAAPDREIFVLPNGIDPLRWRTVQNGVARRDGQIVLVSTMRLHRKKRPIPLLNAFRKAREIVGASGRLLTLKIVGEGPARHSIEAYLARHRLNDAVDLLGAQTRETLQKIYTHADAFVLPSIRESFGIAALEARIAGLPVIAMHGSGASMFLRQGVTALIAENDAALTDNLVQISLDDALRARLARPDAELDRYAWPNVLDDHLAMYAHATRLAQSSGWRGSKDAADQ